MYQKILNKLSTSNARLLAVSKTRSPEVILDFYEKGQLDFGENKVQELVNKYESLPKDIRWHMIGHLQRNKVKQIVPFVHLIHSVDSLRLARKINTEAKKINRIVDVLIQIELSEEESKFGWKYNELVDQRDELLKMDHIRIRGFMGMATNTNDKNQIQREFSEIKTVFEAFKKLVSLPYFNQLSIGMSLDYLMALKEGSTIVRIGSAIFGPRNYN